MTESERRSAAVKIDRAIVALCAARKAIGQVAPPRKRTARQLYRAAFVDDSAVPRMPRIAAPAPAKAPPVRRLVKAHVLCLPAPVAPVEAPPVASKARKTRAPVEAPQDGKLARIDLPWPKGTCTVWLPAHRLAHWREFVASQPHLEAVRNAAPIFAGLVVPPRMKTRAGTLPRDARDTATVRDGMAVAYAKWLARRDGIDLGEWDGRATSTSGRVDLATVSVNGRQQTRPRGVKFGAHYIAIPNWDAVPWMADLSESERRPGPCEL